MESVNEENELLIDSTPGTSKTRMSSSHIRASSRNTSNSIQRDTHIIIALTENKMREIGMAAIDLKAPQVLLSQFVDSHTFLNTFTKLQNYEPVEIIVPKTTSSSELSKMIQNRFPETKFTDIYRKYFNETKGIIYLRNLVLQEYLATVECMSTNFLCLAAAAALITYCEFSESVHFVNQTLRVSFSSGDKFVNMDAETMKNLEILMNSRSGSKKESLFGILNHTQTQLGMRLLRATLVQPSIDLTTINLRQDAVEEFLNNEKMHMEVKSALSDFLDLDQIVSKLNLIIAPKNTVKLLNQTTIKNIILLKHTITSIPKILESLNSSENELLRAIEGNLRLDTFNTIALEINNLINEDCQYSKSAYHFKMQQIFAIRTGINGLLDVARKTYTETIEDMHNLANTYKEKYPEFCSSLKLQYASRRGYFFSMDIGKLDISPPSIFIQSKKQGTKFICSTEELNRLTSRSNDALNEILILTEKILGELVLKVRSQLGSLYKLSDSIALLDMLSSFATLVQSSNTYVRPELYLEGPLVIKQGRHPIMEKLNRDQFIPNDCFVSDESNFQIITGCNMSGKSTYLKTIALVSVMAHIGSFVPATYFASPLRASIFARIGTSDQIETNSSSFMKEMTEMSFILKNATNTSLVLIDELGRSTSNLDAVSLSWSICESLIQTQAFTFFVTHYQQLCDLSVLYSNVKNFHFIVKKNSVAQLEYTFQITDGCEKSTAYGIATASEAGLDKTLIETASLLRKQIDSHHIALESKPNVGLIELGQKLLSIKSSTLSQEALKQFCVNLQLQHTK